MGDRKIKNKIKKLPDKPGVYIFLGSPKLGEGDLGKGKPIYIGKATSLKSRVRSYFSKDLSETRGPLLVKMILEATDINFEKTDSVFEALILESNLIKKHQPKYNTKAKDNKSFNHIIITNEDFPRILLVRGRELEEADELGIKYSFGPYPLGGELKEALKIIRKVFPFRDKCSPNLGRPCFNRQIGLCPGVCTGEISKKEYSVTIKNIKLLLNGKKDTLVKWLGREMKILAKQMKFEKANKVKKQIFALNHIKDIALIKEENSGTGLRVEGYDVAHISGTSRVGVMVVIEDGLPKKSDYRKFAIKTLCRGDTDALKEVLERRLAHSEWPLPRLFVVDGGVGQLKAFSNVLENSAIEIPVVAVVKNERHQPKEILGDKKIARANERDIILANSEAHRFAIAYHKKLRGRI